MDQEPPAIRRAPKDMGGIERRRQWHTGLELISLDLRAFLDQMDRQIALFDPKQMPDLEIEAPPCSKRMRHRRPTAHRQPRASSAAGRRSRPSRPRPRT
jgi:hypothetical protein